MQPEYIFETSWEVCQKIGGIYAVLSTRAAIMQQLYKDHVFFIGPDNNPQEPNQYFHETKSLLADWRKQALAEGLNVRVGRWLVPGKPIAILVDYKPFFALKNSIYYDNWQHFGVNSIAAYGDYDESSVFAYATGRVMESIYNFYHMQSVPVVAHFNEWTTSFGLFYVKQHLPKVATIFTTHATSIGRSIAGNNKPLYDYFTGYHGDQMAEELNMVSKHSTEKQAAKHAHCFTTVSELTNRECAQLLDKPADVVTPNGFESGFLPKTLTALQAKRKTAQLKLRSVAQQVLGYPIDSDALLIATGGRYEFKNKGIDLLLHALGQLKQLCPKRQIIAFFMIPAWQQAPHASFPQPDHLTTHQLVEPWNDPISCVARELQLDNAPDTPVKIIFIPSYLQGNDGILNLSYYDLLAGIDLTVFPSYYEPWGYTPLESIAFHVPTITTTTAGFGLWAQNEIENNPDKGQPNSSLQPSLFPEAQPAQPNPLQRGVLVVKRTDSNFLQAAQQIATAIMQYASITTAQQAQAEAAAAALAQLADWKHFFKFYQQAYEYALNAVSDEQHAS